MTTPMESTTKANSPNLATLGCSIVTSGTLGHRLTRNGVVVKFQKMNRQEAGKRKQATSFKTDRLVRSGQVGPVARCP